jgi:hypothetical protein
MPPTYTESFNLFPAEHNRFTTTTIATIISILPDSTKGVAGR